MFFQFVYVFSLLCLIQVAYCQYQSEYGPTFSKQPRDTFITETGLPSVTLDCLAIGMPEPTYTWSKLTPNNQSLPLKDNHSVWYLNIGYLVITNPTRDDEGTYQCKASNVYGTIISTAAQLIILELGNFSNVPPPPTVTNLSEGAVIECPDLHFSYRKSVLSYRWYKDNLTNEITPNSDNKTFISANGKLYFSEVSTHDQGKYYCQVTISPSMLDGKIIGQNQVRTSLPIDLKVQSFNPTTTFSLIPTKDFPYIQPSTPLKGSQMRVECFAYGPGELNYTWSRSDNTSMPAYSRFESNNRVLVVDKVALDNGGQYVCTINSTASHQMYVNVIDISIEMKPLFTSRLTNQLYQPGSRLTWYCEADGIPEPTYTWYKNGVELKSSSRMTVDMKTLTIYSVNGNEDNGMYQCEARNIHGSVYNTAHLQISSDDRCVGCSRSDINYGSWKEFLIMLTMFLLII